LAKIVAVVLLAEAVFCQENVDPVRRLRFRRPRPKLIDVDNPDGDLRGSPVELRLAESELSAAIAEETPLNFRNQNSGSAALDALIATAQREKPAPVPQPQVLEIEEIPTQRPLRLSPQRQPEPTQLREESPTRAQRVRTRGGVPNRRRPRPEGEAAGRGEEPRRRPNGPQREEPIATLERYSHKNDDGSFTFGYVGADGSFREETRGADCITRGKYGYIDPDGVKREYTYTSGLPCEVGDESNDLDDGDINVEDPVDPRERFRQTQNEQLTEDQIPQAARPRRPIQRRPAQETESTPIGEANSFSNFGANAQRAQIPARRPTVNRGNLANGNALQSLQAIATGDASSQAAPVRPAPARAPVRIAQRPVQASPRPAAPVNQGTFDFDAELEGFTLNRPSITFDQNRQNAQNAQKAQNPSSFQSQLSFDQNTGTFQTNLQQNIQGGQQINLRNPNAPSGAATTAAPQTFAPTPRQSPRPTTIFQNSTPRPSPTSFPVRVNPSPSPQGSRAVLPAGTIKLGFEPLNIPDIAAVKVNLPTPTPAPIRIAPTQALTQRPTPAPIQIQTPAPTRRPTPVRINLTEAPRQSQPVRIASPTPAAPAPATPSAPAAPANTFFVFQPFSQQQPASAPFSTPVNPNAFQVRPAQPQAARPLQQQAPRPIQPQAARPIQPQAARPIQPQPPRQVQPQAARPVPQIPQRVPIPQAAAPQGAPQLQFGFQPVPQGQPQPQRPLQPQPQRPLQPQPQRPLQPQPQRPLQPQPQRPLQPQPPRQLQQRPAPQQQRPAPQQFQGQRPAPFTAFGGQRAPQFQARPAPPQQLQARPAPPQQFQGRPQLGIPPQLQQPQGAPQFAQFDSRFAPRPQGQAPGQVQFRPAQFQPGQQRVQPGQQQSPQFSVFSPQQQLRGA